MKQNQQLETTVQAGLLVLVALMPFHAFFSVWLGHLLGHEAVIQAWKEVLLVVLGGVTTVLVWRDPSRLSRLRQPWALLTAAFVILALIVSVATRPSLTNFAFGAKTDLEFLVAAILAALVGTPAFVRRLIVVILAGAALVIAVGLAQAYLLAPDFFRFFGYGPGTVMPYEHIVKGVTALRFPSTLGGPNQLGTYLVLPLCLSLALAIRQRRWWLLALTATGLIVLFGTYSRSAWLGAFAALAITFLVSVPKRSRLRAAIAVTVVIVAGLVLIPAIAHNPTLRYVVLHSDVTSASSGTTKPSSDQEHAASLRSGVNANTSSPLGHGLGTAGPATFHAGTGNIIENYFLQVGFETGIGGALLFTSIVLALIFRLAVVAPAHVAAAPVAAAIFGISLVALVLPAWTDSSTALITWTTAGALAGLNQRGADV